MTKILVTGGAGTLGSHVVRKLLANGYTVRIMSRKSQPGDLLPGTEWVQGDLESGRGIEEAVSGVDVIVHAASHANPLKNVHTQRVDVDGTRTMLEKARAAGVAHVVYISIVGIDRVSLPYYQCKLATEDVIKNGGIPWSILRATQFHSFIDLILQEATKLPLVAPLPTDFRCQPVDEGEVAARLCEIVTAGPAKANAYWPDMGGPAVLTLGEMAHTWLAQRHLRRTIIPLYMPGKAADGFRRGGNTCPEHAFGKVSWEAWLQEKYGDSVAQESLV
jgi:uncharacterized protein YbjT (DUF2867 family)